MESPQREPGGDVDIDVHINTQSRASRTQRVKRQETEEGTWGRWGVYMARETGSDDGRENEQTQDKAHESRRLGLRAKEKLE